MTRAPLASLFSRLFRFALLASLLLVFAVPAFAAEFDLIQRVKNTASQADAEIATTVLASPGDSLRHLIAIRNADNFTHSYSLAVQLPLLMRQVGTLEWYRDDAWQAAPDSFELLPFETRFFRFQTSIQSAFPNENRVLTVIATARDDQGSEQKVVSQIYVPHFQPSEALPEEYETPQLTESEARELLAEEREIMERRFAELMAQPIGAEPAAAAAEPAQNLAAWLLGFGSICLVIVFVYASLHRRP